jgi:hypothetical protein
VEVGGAICRVAFPQKVIENGQGNCGGDLKLVFGKGISMATSKREFIPNQIFVGLPWRNVRPKYDRIIIDLEKKYPLHFSIVGRNDGQEATDLFEIIKSRIESSSCAVFDATGGNPNVSLEYGYAEGIGVPRYIFLSAHQAAQRNSSGTPIISDLHGMRRVQYKTERTLSTELHKLCREHDYTKRFEKAFVIAVKGKDKGQKKSARALSIKIIHCLDGKDKIRRAELVQHLQAKGYGEPAIESMLKKLHSTGIIKCTVGRFADVHVA